MHDPSGWLEGVGHGVPQYGPWRHSQRRMGREGAARADGSNGAQRPDRLSQHIGLWRSGRREDRPRIAPRLYPDLQRGAKFLVVPSAMEVHDVWK